MKSLAFGLAFLFSWVGLLAQTQAQTKYFEGELQYQVMIHSRLDGLSDQDVGKALGSGSTVTVYMKDGRYRRTGIQEDDYYMGAENRLYIKFAKIDTLYWMDFSADTSRVTGVVKSDSIFDVDHYPCKMITINSPYVSRRYYYSPELHNNPRTDSANTIGHFDVFDRETGGAIYLWSRIEYLLAAETDSCIRVEAKPIDDHLFDLPALPQKRLALESIFSRGRLPGNSNSWQDYIRANLDSRLAAKYVKLIKGQDEAAVMVYVTFMVNENGQISNIDVVNRDDVHPKLAAEAERVIRESPPWPPTLWNGEKVSVFIRQPIIFKVMRQ